MTCPYCQRYFSKKQAAVDHITQYHSNMLERDHMDACQSLYFHTHGTIKGKCMCGCGKDTEWNYQTGKPYKVSSDPKCRERLSKAADKNMMRVHGTTTLLNDMEHQKEMQQHRPTAGKYKFADGGEVPFLSKPEEKFLQFCDTILDLASRSVQESPEVFTYYDSKDERNRKYIPDFYLPDYNLLVEIKDGGEHPNTNPAFIKETKYKVAMKDEAMRKQTKYNFIKIVDNNYGPFVELLYQIVHKQGPENYKKPAKNMVIITESACMDIDEQMDFVSVQENFNEMWLHVVYMENPELVIGVGIGESKYMARLYYSNRLDNTLSEICGEDLPGDARVQSFRYSGEIEKLEPVMRTIITLALSGNAGDNWDILDILAANDIYFTTRMIGNNSYRRMDFTVYQIVEEQE